jgi:hypothetical protein
MRGIRVGIAIFQGIRSGVLALSALLLDLYKSATERPPNKQIAIMISVINKPVNDMVCDTTGALRTHENVRY